MRTKNKLGFLSLIIAALVCFVAFDPPETKAALLADSGTLTLAANNVGIFATNATGGTSVQIPTSRLINVWLTANSGSTTNAPGDTLTVFYQFSPDNLIWTTNDNLSCCLRLVPPGTNGMGTVTAYGVLTNRQNSYFRAGNMVNLAGGSAQVTNWWTNIVCQYAVGASTW